MWQVEVFQASEGVTLPFPMQSWFWLVTRHQGHEMCSTDRPGEERGRSQAHTHAQPRGSRCHMAAPEPSAGEGTWASASQVTEAHVHVMHRRGLLSRQAGGLPSSPVPLSRRQSVTARLHVLCVD